MNPIRITCLSRRLNDGCCSKTSMKVSKKFFENSSSSRS